MRQKLKDLFIYHMNLDNRTIIDLLIAFEKGHLEYIKQHVNEQNVNQSIGVCGFLPLELSIIYDHRDLFEFLVYELNANINIKNKTFQSMSFIALEFQRRRYLFELLHLDISCLYERTSDSQRTLVHQAAMHGDFTSVKRLLDEFGFYKNLNENELEHLLYDKYGCSPLYYACWFGYIQVVEILLNACSESSNFAKDRLRTISFKAPALKMKSEDTTYDSEANSDFSDDDVLLLPTRPTLKKPFYFEDSSLAISLLYNWIDCAKLLLTRSMVAPCIRNAKGFHESSCSTELDSWFSASMKLNTNSKFQEIADIFHELTLNGAKFSNYMFTLLDSIPSLSQFQKTEKIIPIIKYRAKLKTNELANYTFFYNAYFSNFFKCLTLMCNYNLARLLNGDRNSELFLKSMFLKINEMFLVNNNWHMIDMVLLNSQTSDGKNLEFPVCQEYVRHNHQALEWFIFDFEKFLKSLYTNGLGFKYFSNKVFFNFLRRRKFIYYLIETSIYTESTSSIYPQNWSDYMFNGQSKYLDYMQVKALCGLQKPILAKPLSLAKLAKCQVKNSLRYIDCVLIEKLDLPAQLKVFLGAELAKGLASSYERSRMNKMYYQSV